MTKEPTDESDFAQDSDPVADAWRRVQEELAGRVVPSLLVVIGLGDDHLLDALDHYAPQTRVLALEPDAQKASEFLARPRSRAWLAAGRLRYLVDPGYAGADDAWRMFPSATSDHLVLVAPGIAAAQKEGALRAARVLKRVVFGARANAEARRRFAPRYLANALNNLPAIAAGQDIRALTNVYRGTPAIIAAAGPSLNLALADLSHVDERAVLIAVDTALRPLLHAGLAPQLAITLDPSLRNARHFGALPACRDTWLVCESAIDASAVAPFADRTFWFRVADHHPWPWFNALGIDVGMLEVWGSVLTGALGLAMLAGCDPIVLVGADLSFTDDRPYARGTTYEFDWTYSTALGDDLDRAWRMQMAMLENVRVPDMFGRETNTSTALQAFRDWLLSRAVASGRRVINATGAGIFFGPGVEQMSLLDALPATHRLPSLTATTRRSMSAAVRQRIAAQCRGVLASLDTEQVHAAPLAQWAEFSGEAFNPREISAALSATAELTGANVSVTAQSPSIPWTALTTTPATQAIVAQRPEAMARLRAAINSAPLPALAGTPPLSGVDGNIIRLAHALSLLGPLFDALATLPLHLQVPLVSEAMGTPPAAGICAWPETIAWPMQVVEALFGGTCSTSWPASDESFFTRDVSPRDGAEESSASDPSTAAERLTARARSRLALEWLVCANEQQHAEGQLPEASFGRLFAWAAAAERVLSSGMPSADDPGAILELEGCVDGQSVALRLPLGDERFLARSLTGMVRMDSDGISRTASNLSAGTQNRRQLPSISMALRLADTSCTVTPSPQAGSFLMTPHVLTDAGIPRSFHLYTTAAGAVAAVYQQARSILIKEDGSIAWHSEWPRPIRGVLPFEAGGLVAWGEADHADDSGDRPLGYVMYRRSVFEEPVIVQDLTFRPIAGAWWEDRVYWTLASSGLVSWAPDSEAVAVLSGPEMLSIDRDGSGLLLLARPSPRGGRRRNGNLAWCPGGSPQPVPPGPFGGTSCRSTDKGWTATAFAEADLVQISAPSGAVATLTCYYPLTLAWSGASLLVGTIDGELLLFEDLRAILEQSVLTQSPGPQRLV